MIALFTFCFWDADREAAAQESNKKAKRKLNAHTHIHSTCTRKRKRTRTRRNGTIFCHIDDNAQQHICHTAATIRTTVASLFHENCNFYTCSTHINNDFQKSHSATLCALLWPVRSQHSVTSCDKHENKLNSNQFKIPTSVVPKVSSIFCMQYRVYLGGSSLAHVVI